MKMKRLLSCIMALLLVVSLLPIAAMAETPMYNPEGKTVEEIPSGDLMPSNDGTVTNNNGYVTTNGRNGTITNNGTAGGGRDSGHVSTNSGKIVNNYGYVCNNYGTINYNQSGSLVEGNNSGAIVETNAENATIKSNVGTVGKKDENGNVVEGSGNSGTIKENYGTVISNNAGGTVETNTKRGTIEVNNGLVGVKDGNGDPAVKAGTGNAGTIETNKGTVILNQRDGTVGKKEENGSVVSTSGNYGTIEENKGTVLINQEGGTIDVNNGVVGELVDGHVTPNDNIGNYGTVNTNNGTITTNHKLVDTNGETGYIYANDGQVNLNKGSISHNNNTLNTNDHEVIQNDGEVTTNNGTITQNYKQVTTNNGEVEQNFGTVETNAIDGDVRNRRIREDAATFTAAQDAQAVAEGEVQYNFGTVKDHTNRVTANDPPIIYYGLSWGDNVQSLTPLVEKDLWGTGIEKGTPINLNDYLKNASRSGYKMTGYTAYYREDGADVEIGDTANYLMNAPTWLKILWEKITGKPPVSSDEPETKTVQNNIPTSLSADQVKVGAYVRRGNVLFRIIEVTDNDIRVATVGKLSEKSLADMMGFLKQHLSDAQIAKIIGEPELLEQELVTHFFGDSREHIAFRASRDLFA